MSTLTLHFLGSPLIELDGQPIHIPRHKAVALLAHLAMTGQTHRRDALATLLWPESDQSSARAGLRRALAALKDALGEGWLNAERETIALNRDAQIEVDVRAFHERLTGCAAHRHALREDCPTCLSLLTEAAELYRGDFLTGFTLRDSPAFDDWQFFQAQALRDELADALRRLAKGVAAQDAFDRAIPHARRWLALDPLHEPAHRALMLLYARADQHAAALRQYEECEHILQEELGVPPSAETTALYQAIKERRELPAAVVRNQVSDRNLVSTQRKHNLPAQVTPFVGREALLSEIEARLTDPDCRLLTLVGPGGSGKTRLALEAASRRLNDYVQGIFFVSLAPLDAVESIVPTVAQALGFSFHGEEAPKAQLLAYLRDKQMLLILDNYEHLLEGATLATEILEAATKVAIMATSRARLSVRGESCFPVEGMDVPPLPSRVQNVALPGRRADGGAHQWAEGKYSAVKLFLDGARRAQPGFELTGENVADVARVCNLVEGMPLGILLAAAWAALFTPAEIAAEISRSLDFLANDERDVPERQRSVRAVFDHSWKLLAGREREAFAALSVFRGGFTRQAAERVIGTSPRELMALADKSLLHRTPTGRYELHELLRQYAADKLAESPGVEQQVRDRHSAFYAATLAQWDDALKGARQLEALGEIEADSENARVAWAWAAKQRHVRELDQAMDGLCRFYEWRGRYEEGDTACRAVIDTFTGVVDGKGDIARAKATAWRGAFNRALRRLEQAQSLLEESLAQLETLASLTAQDIQQEKAFALWQLGCTLYDLGSFVPARQRYEDSLATYRTLGDRWGMASVSHHFGDLICMAGAPHEAEPLVREGLATQQTLGDRRGMAGSLRVLGVIAVSTGRLEESVRLVEESVALFQRIGDRAHTAEALLNLGYNLSFLGQLEKAHARLSESVAIYRGLGFGGSWSSMSLSFLGRIDVLLGQYEQAADRAREALVLAQEGGHMMGIGSAIWVLSLLAIAAGEYAQAEEILEPFLPETSWTSETVDFIVISSLAYAAGGLGQLDRVRQPVCKALRFWSETSNLAMLLNILPAITLFLSNRGQMERAVELYALASRYPFVANAQWFEDAAGKHIAAAAASLPPEVVAAAQERGRARDLEATVKELLEELEQEADAQG